MLMIESAGRNSERQTWPNPIIRESPSQYHQTRLPTFTRDIFLAASWALIPASDI
jgi:hypothetical protein